MNDNVVQLQPEPASYIQGQACCLACKHEWVAVVPAGTVFLECPSCGVHKGVTKYPCDVDSGRAHWVCNCGCYYFFIDEDTKNIKCANCGVGQRF